MPIDWRGVDPAKLEPQFRTDVEALLGPSAWTWTVLYGLRTGAEQAALYAKYQAGGPKAAPPGQSPHEYGLAVDIVPDADPDTAGLQPNWNPASPAWQWLFEAVHRHPRLTSGKAFNDSDHLERYAWRDYKNWRHA